MEIKPRQNQIFRHIIQIIFGLLFPGLFGVCFSQLKALFKMAIKSGGFTVYAPFLCEFLIVLITTILFGRFFCGYICSFGSLMEGWHFISNKFLKINLKISSKVDKYLRLLKYLVLILIILFLWVLNINILNSFSPWDAMAELRDFPDVIFMYNVGLVILVFIIFGEVFFERFFCRYLCPLGAFLNLAAFYSFNIRVKCSDKSIACEESCTLGNASKYKTRLLNECISCNKCIDYCDYDKTQISSRLKYNNIINKSVIIITCILLILIFKGGLPVETGFTKSTDALKIAKDSGIHLNGSYANGTFIGIGIGYRQDVEVKVTIEDNMITDIYINSNNESSGFREAPFIILPPEMIKKQSADVDSISGATRTSNGLIMAVEDALSEAGKN